MAFQDFGNSNVSEQVPASRESSDIDEVVPYGFVVRKTFLELVDVEATSSGNARRRVRSLDDKWSHRYSSPSGARSRETPGLVSPPSVDVNDTEIDASPTRCSYAPPTRSTCSPPAGHSEGASTAASSSSRVPPAPERGQPGNSNANGRRRDRNRTRQQPDRNRPQEWHTIETRAAMAARLESGTTVMVQNLPRDMSQVAFAWAVEGFGFRGLYDFLYMPTCFKSGRSKGYAFVNLLDADLAVSFALTCESRGIRVSRACVQGHAAIRKYLHRLTRRVRNTRHLPIFAHGLLGLTDGSDTQSSRSLETPQHGDELVTYRL